jgi:phage I-like protein
MFADGAETVLQLMRWGENKPVAIDGRDPFYVDETSIQSIRERFNSRENVPHIDYDHGTLIPSSPRGSMAAGWINQIWPLAPGKNPENAAVKAAYDESGPGIYAQVTLTPAATKMVREGEYRYLSPVVDMRNFRDDRVVTELLHVGLTNNPALDGLRPLSAHRILSTDQPIAGGERQGTGGINPTRTNKEQVKMPDEVDTNVSLAALSTLFGVIVQSFDDVKEHVSTLVSAAKETEALTAQVATLEKQVRESDATAIVAEAMSCGAISQDGEKEKVWLGSLAKTDPEMARGFIETAKGRHKSEAEKPPQGAMALKRQVEEDGEETPAKLPDGVAFSRNLKFSDDPDKTALKTALARLRAAHQASGVSRV